MENKNKYFTALLLVLLIIVGAGSAEAKSVYVIDNINANPSPVSAYDIQIGSMVYQTTNTVPYYGWGAVGLAIDTDSAYLFVTYEQANEISIVDATTMTVPASSPVTAPGASNLAGIVVDQGKHKVYTMDRHTNHLYVYSWDPTGPTLTLDGGTYTSLPHTGNMDAYGIALDEVNDLLYVSSYQEKLVRYYDTATWTEQGSFAVTINPMGIAVDVTNGYVYTGGMASTKISKYNLNTNTETTKIVSSNAEPIGFAVDPATSNLFVTTYSGSAPYGDVLLMYDSNLNELDKTLDLGNPTGVCVPGKDISFNPLNLAKTDGVTTVLEGGQLTYTITFDNAANSNPVTGISLVDTLPPEVTFVAATGPGAVYDGVTHTVSWTIADLAANAPSQTVTVTVTVNSGTLGTILDNAVTINGNEQGTGPTTRHDDDTEVVAPTTNAFIVSSDSAGTEKNVFELNENVYCYAGNLPVNDPAVDIYIIPNKAWSVNDPIGSDVSGGVETVSTDGSGNIVVTQIWTALLTAGKYDIIVDVNQNGALDANEPVDGLTMGEGFEAIPEFPTIAIPMIAILGLAFMFQRRKD
jgi:uncharacterized repeat protein (TIGR01451 family)